MEGPGRPVRCSKLPCVLVVARIRIYDPCLPLRELLSIPEPSGSRLPPCSAEVSQDVSSLHSLAQPHTYTHRNTPCLSAIALRRPDSMLFNSSCLLALHTEPLWTLKIILLLNRAIRGHLKLHVLLPSGASVVWPVPACFCHPLWRDEGTSPSQWPLPGTSSFLWGMHT